MKKIIVLLLVILELFLLVACENSSNYIKNKYNGDKKELSQMLYNSIGPITNLTSMQELIDDGANVDEVINFTVGDFMHGNNKESMLEKAYEYNLEAVKILIKNGANVNYKLSDGSTTFFNAVKLYDFDLCDLYIDNGADIKVKNVDGYNALDSMLLSTKSDMILEYNEKKKMIEYLEEKGMKLSYKSVQSLLKYSEDNKYGFITNVENIGMLRIAVKKLIDNNEKTGLNRIIEYALQGDNKKTLELCNNQEYIGKLHSKEKEMLLYVCAAYCNVDVIKALEKNKINLQSENADGINSLFCAVAYNTKDVVKYLLEKDIRINSSEEYIGSAIEYALLGQNIDVIKILLENDKVKIGYGEIENLVYINNNKILKLFIPYLKMSDNYSLDNMIGEAIVNGNTELLEILANNTVGNDVQVGIFVSDITDISCLDYAFDLQLKINKEDILYHAISNHNLKLVEYMIDEHNVDLNYQLEGYEKPLIAAINIGNIKIIDCLIDNGADIYIKEDGENIVEVSKKMNYSKKVINHIEKIWTE